MDLRLTPDQEALQSAVRSAVARWFPMAEVRRLGDAGGVDRSTWADVAGLGVFSLRVPAHLGGAGLGLAEAVVVFEQLGRALVPGPLVATELAVSAGLVEVDTVAVVGLVDRIAEPLLVECLGALDSVLVLTGASPGLVPAGAVRGKPVSRPLDPLAPLHRVEDWDGSLTHLDPAPHRRSESLRLDGALLTAAYLAGSAAAVTESAVAYALQREQFGRPVGGFQAVKHLLADMHVRATLAQSAVYAAAAARDAAGPDGAGPDGAGPHEAGRAERAVRTAKVVATTAAVATAKSAIQVHGGMGFTWEVDAHLHLKRAWYLDTVFGSADDHAGALGAPARIAGQNA